MIPEKTKKNMLHLMNRMSRYNLMFCELDFL